ncbi:CPBP family intramembrane metalloprotease [Candidatus Bathyarchaeota archaeon]|nr:CPBP family intramembrane metalloprotease [Candidatus Bathyarchaeota archaeon]
MDNQLFWKAKSAFYFYLFLIGGLLLGSIIVSIILFELGFDPIQLNFPSALISLPINEGIILLGSFLFAKKNNITLEKLGLKKPSFKVLLIIFFATFFLILLALGISIFEQILLGPDPQAEIITAAILPKDFIQLVLLIIISLTLVGPAEEIAFRGIVQRGFESSYGKNIGLIVASLLFGILHGLNSLRAIIPVTIISLILGYVWQKTDRNTFASAWMHGLYDAITILLAYFAFT